MSDIHIETEFKNFISLGYFCEVAEDLEKMGLRNTSCLLIGVSQIFLKILN